MDPTSLEAAGWQSFNADGFTGQVGPFWVRSDGKERTLGLLVEERHCNNHINTLHGGVVMTFADIGLGLGVAGVLGEERMNAVTASLQTQFVSIARIGDFITCQAELVRRTKQLVFVRGLIKAGEKTIASAEGIWSVFDTDRRQ